MTPPIEHTHKVGGILCPDMTQLFTSQDPYHLQQLSLGPGRHSCAQGSVSKAQWTGHCLDLNTCEGNATDIWAVFGGCGWHIAGINR
jgi:hypothetical protein